MSIETIHAPAPVKGLSLGIITALQDAVWREDGLAVADWLKDNPQITYPQFVRLVDGAGWGIPTNGNSITVGGVTIANHNGRPVAE